VLDLEGDLTSSNGADRTDAFDACMKANDPSVKVLKEPTVWTDATAVTDAQNAINAYGSQLKAIYSQWSSPDTGIIPLLKSKGLGAGSANPMILISDDGVPFEMCDIGKRLGHRVAVAARQPVRAVRADLRRGRGQGRQARGGPARRRRADLAERHLPG